MRHPAVGYNKTNGALIGETGGHFVTHLGGNLGAGVNFNAPVAVDNVNNLTWKLVFPNFGGVFNKRTVHGVRAGGMAGNAKDQGIALF